MLIPDPRVSQRTSDRVLRLLAERGAASARDAAGALHVSLRTAQAALTELAGSGACDARKAGRNVAYVVEDTVFSEPSRRLSASDLAGLTPLPVVR
jgi:predicted transcriptional regulator